MFIKRDFFGRIKANKVINNKKVDDKSDKNKTNKISSGSKP